MDLDHVEWFARSEGSWVSHRRYLYGNKRTSRYLSLTLKSKEQREEV